MWLYRVQIPVGYSWTILYYNCPSSTPYPFLDPVNVNLVAASGSTLSLTSSYDNGDPLLGGTYTLSLDGVNWTPPISPSGACVVALHRCQCLTSKGHALSQLLEARGLS